MSMTISAEPDVREEVLRLYKEARSRWHDHHTEDATALLERALELDPHHADSLSLYGLCLANRGLEYKRALASCRQAIRLDPGNVGYQLHIAKVYKRMGDQGSAYKVLLRTWRHHPKHAHAAAELARMGVRKRPPLPFLPRGHVCNRLLGRLRSRMHGAWYRTLVTQVRQQAAKLQKAGHEV